MNEDPVASIHEYAKYIKHFHVSAPQLEAVNKQSPLSYRPMIEALDSTGYTGWVSIEMKQNPDGHNESAVETALKYIAIGQ